MNKCNVFVERACLFASTSKSAVSDRVARAPLVLFVTVATGGYFLHAEGHCLYFLSPIFWSGLAGTFVSRAGMAGKKGVRTISGDVVARWTPLPATTKSWLYTSLQSAMECAGEAWSWQRRALSYRRGVGCRLAVGRARRSRKRAVYAHLTQVRNV